tara:strand:+ start:579 stop:764 length:186 start_codon:yes stop_codon:yes gene_type:complete
MDCNRHLSSHSRDVSYLLLLALRCVLQHHEEKKSEDGEKRIHRARGEVVGWIAYIHREKEI